eukprot:CAMPEP_0202876002 /NCGR_PEP_ID=MMETSP1391-20130828/28318_1 /ASSEMBLY_ACC=CAM_ASM_000867 /TAXON_ID=1034604 /ORGANISM="Chlamydomonas leiostraca, Strain SAG 11-49" /LENGTH=180 /DNA_ID=CAMNT_0049557775 /DNA_START=708 /DNA_END=1249 /DNA_ORIENTATION=+
MSCRAQVPLAPNQVRAAAQQQLHRPRSPQQHTVRQTGPQECQELQLRPPCDVMHFSSACNACPAATQAQTQPARPALAQPPTRLLMPALPAAHAWQQQAASHLMPPSLHAQRSNADYANGTVCAQLCSGGMFESVEIFVVSLFGARQLKLGPLKKVVDTAHHCGPLRPARGQQARAGVGP